MARSSAFHLAIRAGLTAALSAALAGVWLANAQAPNPNFMGKVTPVPEGSQGAIAHFRFEAGARTKWHAHSAGQIILVEEGVGRVQERGGPVIELKAGETIFAKPGVEHWHGASPTSYGVQHNVTRGEIKWLEEVTDEQFNTPPGKR
jgi:quercetin dioxygenase-like cupin family protein